MVLFWIIPFGVAVGLAALIMQLGQMADWLIPWAIAVNIAAFLTYGYDKAVAGSRQARVPELVLLALAAAGGWPLAYAAMQILRHKTAKESFRIRFWLAVALNVVLLVIYLSRR
jgi:uncharacterized membrane protein YsdA (DUF1294 family)